MNHIDLLNPFTVTPDMREFRNMAKRRMGKRYAAESRAFGRMIRSESTSIVDGANRIASRLTRQRYPIGAALAIAAGVDLIEAEEKEFFASPTIHPYEVSDRFTGIRAFMKARGLRFILLGGGGAI